MAEIDLNDLADRVEKLEGPDRDVDYMIFMATANKEVANHWHPERGNRYTSSIDDALDLLPARCWCDTGTTGQIEWACVTSRITFRDFAAKAKTRPNAIAAAALRARLMEGEGENVQREA